MLVSQIVSSATSITPGSSALLFRSLPQTTNLLLVATEKSILGSRKSATLKESKLQIRNFWWRCARSRRAYKELDEAARKHLEARQRALKYHSSVHRWVSRRSDELGNPSASSAPRPASCEESRRSPKFSDSSKQSQHTLDRIQRINQIRRQLEENPFEALFGRSARLVAYPGTLPEWTRNLLSTWIGRTQTRMSGWAKGTAPVENDKSKNTTADQSCRKTEVNDSSIGSYSGSYQSSSEYEIDPITLRKRLVSQQENSTVSTTSSEPSCVTQSPLVSSRSGISEKQYAIPVKTYKGTQSSANNIGSRGAEFQKAWAEGREISKQTPSTAFPEDSWDAAEAGIREKRAQYKAMTSSISASENDHGPHHSQNATQNHEDSSWLQKEGFKATQVEQLHTGFEPSTSTGDLSTKTMVCQPASPKPTEGSPNIILSGTERREFGQNLQSRAKVVTKLSPYAVFIIGSVVIADFQKQAATVSDDELSREVRRIYESTYGKIDTSHRQISQITIQNSAIPSQQSSSFPADPQSSRDHTGLNPVETVTPLSQTSQSVKHVPEISKMTHSTIEQGTSNVASPPPQSHITYRILAYDSQTQEITSATSVSTFQAQVESASDEKILSVPEVLLKLTSPSRFLPFFRPLQREGFELIRGSGDVVVFKKVRYPKVGMSGQPEAIESEDGQSTSAFDALVAAENKATNARLQALKQEHKSSFPEPTRQEEIYTGSRRWTEKEVGSRNEDYTKAQKSVSRWRKLRRISWSVFWIGIGGFAGWMYQARF